MIVSDGARRLRATTGWALVLLTLSLLTACSVQRALTPSLPETRGSVSIGRELSQPFLSDGDGLNRLQLGLPPAMLMDEGQGSRIAGAVVELRWAPEHDPRYPAPPFHEWPPEHEWTGELTGARAIGQSFVSLYPGLAGITLRVATYGADIGLGPARLDDQGPVPVRELPGDGRVITQLPPGAEIEVRSSGEGWALIDLGGGHAGWVDLARVAEASPPARVNDADVYLTLYRADGAELRRARVNAGDMFDNSHVTFAFAPLPDSAGERYRFVLTSPDSEAGNAVTFRYSPADIYADGERDEGGSLAGGDLIFAPRYDAGEPLFSGSLDTMRWSALTESLEARFPPLAGTGDRYLEIVLRPGERPLDVYWSLLRPPGGVPMAVDGDRGAPGGGLVFNAGYRTDIPLGRLAGDALRGAGRAVTRDPVFFALYAALVVGVVVWGVGSARGWRAGRGR